MKVVAYSRDNAENLGKELSSKILRGYNLVLERLSAGADLEEVLFYLVSILEDMDSELRCSILLLDEKTQCLHSSIAPSLPKFYNDTVNGLKIGKHVGSCGAAAFSGKRVIVEDIQSHPNWNIEGFRTLAKKANLQASWSQPIVSSEGKILGTFALYYPRPRRPTKFDLLFIENTAHIAAIAIEKCRKDIELTQQQNANLLLLNSAGEGIFGLDIDSRITFINPAALNLLGYQEQEVIGKNWHELNNHLSEDAEPIPWKDCPICSVIQNKQGVEKRRAKVLHKQGFSFLIEYISTPIIHAHHLKGAVITFNDITQREADKAKLEKLARTDYLTGLTNRVYFEEMLKKAVTEAKKNQSMFALFSIDLNNFKNVNDTLGHQIGDLLLKKISKRLQNIMNSTAILARVGGDEFTILQKNMTSIQKLKDLATTLINVITLEYHIEDYLLRVNASIGIAVFPYDGVEMSELMLSADIALYEAKARNPNNVCFFEERFITKHNRAIKLKRQLHKANLDHEFYFAFQPQINIKSNAVVGVESLLRWNVPGVGEIMPEEFMPVIENDALAFSFNLWCIKKAYEEFLKFSKRATQDFTVSVNLSPKLFSNKKFINSLTKTIKENKINPKKIVIEITEAELVESLDQIEKSLVTLHKLGFKIAIDDFGTGYSSFSRLHKLSVDILKLDYEFISDITSNKNKLKIVSAIINLAKNLDMEVIAEGVEHEDQKVALFALDCEIAQGYYYARPMKTQNLIQYLRN